METLTKSIINPNNVPFVIQQFKGTITDIRNSTYIFDYGVGYSQDTTFYHITYEIEANDSDQYLIKSCVMSQPLNKLGENIISDKLAIFRLEKALGINVKRICDSNHINIQNKPRAFKTQPLYLEFLYRDKLNKIQSKGITEYNLHHLETPEMAIYRLGRLHPNYYIKQIDKPDNQEMEKSRKFTLIKTLRTNTGGSATHCKDAIVELLTSSPEASDEDILLKAESILAKNRQIIAAKKTGNDTNFFIIKHGLNPFDAEGRLLKFGCESEQGVKILKEKHNELLNSIVGLAMKNDSEYAKDVLAIVIDDTYTVGSKLEELSGILNEKVELTTMESIDSVQGVPNTFTKEYIHPSKYGDKTGGILIYNCKEETKESLVSKILQQLVFSNPLCYRKQELLPSILETIEEDIQEQIITDNKLFESLTEKGDKLEGSEKETLKSLKLIPKDKEPFVIKGRVNKFIKEVCFEEQEYMFPDPGEKKQTIKQLLKSNGIEIFDFVVI